MTLSPKKYASHFTSSTAHRGVEAKETDIAHTQLGSLKLDASSSTHFPAESSPASTGAGCAALARADETGSYLQVVVEKHRRERARGGAGSVGGVNAPRESPRLPAASSPLPCNRGGAADCGGERAGAATALPRSLLPACAAGGPLAPALHSHTFYHERGCSGCACGGCAAPPPPPPPPALAHAHQKKYNAWKLFRDVGVENMYDEGPECVEVYYFERGDGDFLATRSGAPPTVCERAAARGARGATAALRELLAAPRLLAALPVALLLHVERCALLTLRHALAGAVQTASDYALKPALALLHNALCAPLLVSAGAAARGVRDVVVPLAQALDALLEPPARLLRAVRLVDVSVHCAPSHAGP